MGDWERPYLTFNPEYEAGIIEVFGKLVEKGYIYRILKPIHWCMRCQTALAEAELEYSDETSPSIYVNFKLNDTVGNLFKGADSDNSYIMTRAPPPLAVPAN